MPSNASNKPPAAFLFDRPLSYAPVQRLQQELVEARTANAIPDTLLLLEHLPVVTLAGPKSRLHLRASAEELAARGIELEETSRGGDITYHGPGQWVLYPILHLKGAAANIHGYVAGLEEIAIRTAADFGVRAYRRSGKTGAWTDAGKLAAIGVRVRRWVTCHGLSFNVDLALDEGFSAIVPCGLHGEPVTSLRALLGASAPDRLAVRAALLQHAGAVLQRVFLPRVISGDALPTLAQLFPA